jgi:hypothetical protein
MLRALFGTAGPPRTDGPAWNFLAVVISLLLTSVLGLTLAEIGWFSVWLIALIELVAVVGVLRVQAGDWRSVPALARTWLSDLGETIQTGARIATGRLVRVRPDARNLRLETAILVLLLIGAAILFARPAEMIRGALDSGVYINSGVALGRTGAIVQHDQLMRELVDLDPKTLKEVDEAKEFLHPQNLQRYTLDRIRMPGFYVLEKKSAMVLPQFYHLYAVWIAACYQLFGLYGALMTTPLLALLACAAVFFFARQMFSARVALVGLAFLITCPLQIWFARYPVSETPTELLAFVFFYTFLRFYQETRRLDSLEAAAARADHPDNAAEAELHATDLNARFFAVLAAGALGAIALTRVDFPLYLAPLAGYLLWWRLSRTWRRAHTWFLVALLLMFAQWSISFFFFTFAYTMDQYHNTLLDVRRAWPRLLPLFYIGVVALLLLDRWQPHWRPLARVVGEALSRRRRWLLGALCLGVALFFAYRYIWEPDILLNPAILAELAQGRIPFAWQSYIGAPLEAVAQTGKTTQTWLLNTNSYILVRLGWYLSPLGMVLGVAGLVRALWKRLTLGTAYFFAVFGIFVFIFGADTYTVATYPYSLRRFLPVVIPGLMILAAYALAWAAEKIRPRRVIRPLAWATAGALVVFFLVTGWVIISHTEDEGAVAQLTQLAQRFPDPKKTVLLFSNERDEPYVVATPLQYIFGFECFSLDRAYGEVKGSNIQQAVQRWQKAGYQVYAILGANGGKMFMPDIDLVPYTTGGPAQWTYNVPELEQLFTQKPKNISSSTLHWGLYELQPRAGVGVPSLPFSLDIGGEDYKYLVAGFSGQERTPRTDDPNYWRWTFPDAFLRVPWSDAAKARGGTITLRLSAGPPERAVHAPPPPGTTLRRGEVPDTPLVPAPAQFKLFAGNLRLQPTTLTPGGADPALVTLQPGGGFQDVTFIVPPNAPTAPVDGNYLLLHLNSTTWSPADAGVSADDRNLGVQVDSVRVDVAP